MNTVEIRHILLAEMKNNGDVGSLQSPARGPTDESWFEKNMDEARSSQDSSSSSELLKEIDDTESQRGAQQSAEHRASFTSKLLFLADYFILNLVLTLSNKAVLGKVA